MPDVRQVQAADLDQVARIYSHYVRTSVATFETEPPGVADWEQKVDGILGRDLPFLVAEADGMISGYCYATPWRARAAYRHTAEDSVYIAPDQTGRGIGSVLLGALLDACAASDVRQVIAVIADSGSDASEKLHAKFGFAHAGRLTGVGHKHGRWIDTVLMQRALA
ncbi:MAG TPA: GNAT family N-acetyltransferase [Streptosporangiaceae bacterium]